MYESTSTSTSKYNHRFEFFIVDNLIKKMHVKNLLAIKKVNALACSELMTCRSVARVNLLRYGVKHQNRERKNILLLILKKKLNMELSIHP